MSDEAPDSTQQIESLLADRQRLRGWLDRLEAAQDRAPAQVKSRVRADYEGRLAEVVARLGGFSTAISASLESLRGQRAAYESKRAEIEEARAEAGLRHDVGEFSDEEWSRVDGDANQNIQALSGEIGRLSAEISRLDEVLSQVSPPEPPRREPPPPRAPLREVRSEDRLDIHVLEPEELTLTPRGKHSGDDNQNVVTLDPDTMDDIEAIRPESRPAPVEAPRFTPKTGSNEPKQQAARDRGPARTIRFPTQQPPAEASGAPAVDEMTFLKSVTLDSPASRERAAADKLPSASNARARSPNASKTLKCAECGSMNKPTEWYCERCGAELAAL